MTKQRHFALLVVDLGDFKAINDSLGHSAGDRLLHAVGERLRNDVRSRDTVARLGGDECAVVLDGAVETACILSQRILTALQQPFETEGATLSLSASLGASRPAATAST